MASGLDPAGHELSLDFLLSDTFNIDFGSLGGSAGGAYSNSLLAHGQGSAGGGFAAPFPNLQFQVRPICCWTTQLLTSQCISVSIIIQLTLAGCL